VHSEIDEEAMYCSAFPDRIPQEVMFGVLDHRNPIPGDGGIQFEPDPDLDAGVFEWVYENMDRIARRVAEEGE
jgi:hypothetical protein